MVVVRLSVRSSVRVYAAYMGRIEPKFCLVVGVHDIITLFKFGDDRFRGFWLAEGQRLPFCHRL